MTNISTRLDRLVTVTPRRGAQYECVACPVTITNPEDFGTEPQVTILAVEFHTGKHSSMGLRYCEAHFAQLLAELEEEIEE
jgi:hypothetical protein